MDVSLAQIHEAISEAIPDRECLIFRDRRLTFREVTERTRRLANYLIERGLGIRKERSELQSWESGQDHLAIYLYNGNEYLEGMLGAYKARVVPFNVNYRYVEEELIYLLKDAKSKGMIFHSEFAPTLDKIRAELPDLEVLIQVSDESGNALLPGAVEYEAALAGSSPEPPKVVPSPDDLYILYTGGTTGMPKGVLWRQADIFVTAMGGSRTDGSEYESIDAIIEAAKGAGLRSLPAPPMMHGAAQWVAFLNWTGGNTVVMQNEVHRMDPDDVLSTAERHKANGILIVGDAFARPILDQLRKKTYDLSELKLIASGGAVLAKGYKKEFLELLPHVMILDAIGSSETGSQGRHLSTKTTGVDTGKFAPDPATCVVSEDMTRVLPPGSEEVGWFAKRGRVPLGYLGDPEKTKQTFPVIDGQTFSVPGDRAQIGADGIIEVFGRDSATINSGGEKIFAEEVELAVKHHPSVYDVVVAGRPSELWGQEVVAIVQLREGVKTPESELLEECSKHIARYKHPKAFVFVEQVVRSPSGKADYRWAKERASQG
ncbi:MAG: acyl-CoA synthetase [Myxococcota bacterium]